MKKYVIERDLPSAGDLGVDELRAVSQRSNEVLATMPDRAQWQHSYVTDDKLFCVYLADGPETIREHAACGDFPISAIHRVRSTIDPTTGAES